jgi:hypothetical protein
MNECKGEKMKTRWLRSLSALLLGLPLAAPLQATEILLNGGFETGDFTGWNVGPNPGAGGCDQAWTVAASGSECQPLGAPVGGFGAYTSLDGSGPLTRTISQSFVLAGLSAATLAWSEAAQVDNAGSLPREFSIDLRDAGNVLIANLYNEAFAAGASTGFGLTAHSLDLSALLAAHVGENVNIAFSTIVPENFTGPAGFLLDAVSLDVTAAAVPEPASLALLAIGAAAAGATRRRRINSI